MPVALRRITPRALSLAVLLGLACLCLNIGCLNTGGPANQNATQSFEGTISVPPNSEVEVVYPAPFAAPPKLTIYAFHSDWEVKLETEKFFRIRNKNASKARSVEWKVRGLRVMATTPMAQYRIYPGAPGGPEPAPKEGQPESNALPTPTVQMGQPR